MRYRITFAAGLAIGYVLGAKAGRQRYEQIARSVRSLAESPAARSAADRVGEGFSAVKERVGERVPVSSVRDFLHRPTPEEEEEVFAAANPGETNGRGR